MALPLAITAQASASRCSRLAPSLAQSAPGLHDRANSLRSWRRFGLGRRLRFFGLPPAARIGSFAAMPPSPMRAMRPNVDRIAQRVGCALRAALAQTVPFVGAYGLTLHSSRRSKELCLLPAAECKRSGGSMEFVPIRLSPGVDLRRALEEAAGSQSSGSAFVVAGIGSLVEARLRYAGECTEGQLAGPLEILSLSGSLSGSGAHLHMSVSDASGRVYGGHVGYGNTVRTTAEVLVVPPRTGRSHANTCDNRVQRVGCSPSGVNAECRLTLRSTPTCYGWLRQPSHAGELKR